MHLFFALLLGSSLRHFWIPGDVLWTEEGHFASWQMRLVAKDCQLQVATEPGKWQEVDLSRLSSHQVMQISSPFVFRQLVRYEYCPKASHVYGRMFCRQFPFEPAELIDPEVDLCQTRVNQFSRNEWVLVNPGKWDEHAYEWLVKTYGFDPGVRW